MIFILFQVTKLEYNRTHSQTDEHGAFSWCTAVTVTWNLLYIKPRPKKETDVKTRDI